MVIIGILAVLVGCMIASGCVNSTMETDDITVMQTSGEVFTLPHTVERIILLNSNAAEMLYLLGASEMVVGVSQSIRDNTEIGSMFPAAMSVGKWNVPDVELISSLSPDVVIAFDSSKPNNADLIEAMGVPILYIDCYKPTTMVQDMRSLGILIGNRDRAEDFVMFYNATLENISTRLPLDVPMPRVFCEGYTDYAVQGVGSGMDLLLGISGGENVLLMNIATGTTKVSPEWLVATDPDVIVKVTTTKNTLDAVTRFSSLVGRPGFSSIKAVRNDRTFLIDSGIVYGPRTFAGALAVAKMLYPEEFSDVDVRSILQEYNEKFGLNLSNGMLVYPELVIS
ncbi:MAG: ABC transporter substrate-binding protein [Methanocalculaceae archaeon]|nr:ABC transporter substrate-binding protein [Methanocalculaceae archaeon]